MRTLKIIEHMSLDGVVQHTADENDFPHGGWNTPYRTPEGMNAVTSAHGDAFDLLIGRRTYDRWSQVWPAATGSPIAERINAATKYVVTHRPESLDWGPAEGVGPDLADGVRRITSSDGPPLIVSGSSTLTSPLLEHGLVDEVLLIIYPILLGTGKRLFAEGTPARSLELVSTWATPSGVILASYAKPGPLKSA